MGSYAVFLVLAIFVVFNVSAQSTLDDDVESTIESPLMENATVAPINEPPESEEPETEIDYCNRPCTRMYLPVCGSKNGNQFEMPNECEFENKVFCELSATKKGESKFDIAF